MAERRLTRRRFLLATGWTAAGVTVLYGGFHHLRGLLPSFDTPGRDAGTAWLRIGPDGRCEMLCPRAEMGQNASIGLAQIAAEELNLDVEDIELRYPDTGEIPQVILTAGSMSLSLFSEPTARAAAGLREVMRRRAAERAGLDLARVEDGVGGFELPGGRKLGYGELADGKPLVLDARDLPAAPLYTFDPKRKHRQVGRGAAPHQAEPIVTGAPVYASDVRLDGMAYGRAVRPPARNAHLGHVDDSRVRSMRGLLGLVVDRERDFVGVVCETPGAVDEALAALDVSWKLPEPFDQGSVDRRIDVDAALARGDLAHAPLSDRFPPGAEWEVDLRFDVQTQSHAMQEPRAAVARFEPEEEADGPQHLEIWTGSQDVFIVQRLAARDVGLPEKRVVVHSHRMGGAFGGREHYDVERDAVHLARAVGRPVKVQWSREDEFRADRNRPPSSHRVRLRADAQGRLTDWWHAFVSGRILFARDRMPGWLLAPAHHFGDPGVSRGCQPPYAAARRRVEYTDVDLPIDLGTWRSLGGAPNTFVIESAIDELAARRKLDPVELRLRSLSPGHERLAACLRRTREMADRVPLPPGPGVGRGFACAVYEEHSFVAASADVRLDAGRGIRVTRMCCVQDVGLPINPDQLRAQVEGNLIWGIGMALKERVTVGSSEVASLNFDRYGIPHIGDAPELEIEILGARDVPPAGAGETALVVGPPAIANAVRRATGHRPTRLPMPASNAPG